MYSWRVSCLPCGASASCRIYWVQWCTSRCSHTHCHSSSSVCSICSIRSASSTSRHDGGCSESWLVTALTLWYQFLARSATVQQQHSGLCVLPLVLILYFVLLFCNDSCQTSYLKIHRTDLRQICIIGRTMTVGNQPEIIFQCLKGHCHGNQFLLVLSTELSSGDMR